MFTILIINYYINIINTIHIYICTITDILSRKNIKQLL